VTTLQYSRDELPIICHKCSAEIAHHRTIKRTTFTETVECSCIKCFEVFNVEISEQ
jgi:ribosomal protein S26